MKKSILFLLISLLFSSFLNAQEKTISGSIKDETGTPIPGVTILVKGTSKGTSTDFEGNYTITANENDILIFSFVGYVTQEISVAGESTLNVTLVEDSSLLDEVVVVGYGTQKKVNLTGAIATVDPEILETRPSESITKMLQGVAPGVTVIDRPGGTSINIRGRGNLGNSTPLFIVDGIEVSQGFFNNIPPSSVESLTFLKDASSAAIYGAKAAYGVVLVTTKNGKEGKFEVTYNGSVGVQSPTYLPKVLNSWEYAELYREAELNSDIQEADLRYSLSDVETYRNGSNLDLYPNTKWIDLVLKDHSTFTRHDLQFSGGGKKVRTTAGLGFLLDESLTPGQENSRFNFNSKTIASLRPWLDVTANAQFIYNKFNRDHGGANTVEMLRVPTTQVAIHSNGEYGSVRDFRPTLGEEANANPLRIREQGGRRNTINKRLLTSLSTIIKPFDGLKITNQLAYNYWDFRFFSFTPTQQGIPNFLFPDQGVIPGTESDENSMQVDWRYDERLSYDGWINYDKTFNDVHEFGAMVGVHADDYKFQNLYVGRRNFASDEFDAIDGGSTDPDDQEQTRGGIQEESSLAYFGRLTYSFDEKYLLEANFRADASSRFSKQGRWGYFPSFSAGWRIDQEKFMTNVEWINSLKLRASWGQNGNINNVGRYDTFSTFATSGTILVGGQIVPTVAEGRLGNEQLTWETTTTTDFGIDAELKNGLLGITFDYYKRVTDDILIRSNDIASETGINPGSIPARNVGSVENSGIELALTHRNTIGDFSYKIGFNITDNNNEITALGGGVEQLPPAGYFIFRKGGSVGDFYMFEADGLYSTQDIADGNVIPFGGTVPEAGMVKLVDQLTVDTNGDGIPDQGDGVINDDDRTVVGNDVPSFTYGTMIEVSYKNFTLSAIGQGVSNVKVYMDNEAAQAFFDEASPRQWQLQRWTPENQNNAYPRLYKETDARFAYNSTRSSYWLFDASYFRMKNVTLSYNVSDKITDMLGLSRARLYFSGDNIFTIRGDKRMKDFDPERSSGRGFQVGMKTITLGASISF